MQPLSRVGRLIAQAQACLSASVDTGAGAANGHPAITSVLREIDANFAPEQLPAELAAAREQLLARLRVEGASGTIGTSGTTLQ